MEEEIVHRDFYIHMKCMPSPSGAATLQEQARAASSLMGCQMIAEEIELPGSRSTNGNVFAADRDGW